MLTQSRGISLFKRITMLVTFMILCSLLVSSTLITKRVPDVFQEKLGSSAMSVAAVVSNNKKIVEIPIRFRKCSDIKRKPHLRTIRDGIRHLLFILKSKI